MHNLQTHPSKPQSKTIHEDISVYSSTTSTTRVGNTMGWLRRKSISKKSIVDESEKNEGDIAI